MPIMKKDDHSGAILFVRTPEEVKSDMLEERVGKLEDLISNIVKGKVSPEQLKNYKK